MTNNKTAVLLVAALAVVLGYFISQQIDSPVPRIISVEGHGEFEVEPDIVHIHYLVAQIDKQDVAVAKAKVDMIASQSVHALMELGVEENDIQSSAFGVEPVRDYNRPGEPEGHRVYRRIEVVLRNVDDYGRAIQALVDSRVSEITRIKPDVSNDAELRRQAMASAAKDARDKAAFLASQFEADLGKVHQIGRQTLQRQFDMKEVMVSAARSEQPQTQIPLHEFEPGKVKVTSDVYVEFVLQ